MCILTSNLAADQLLADVAANGAITDTGRAAAQAAIRRHFRPEFLNRLDKVVLFSPLSRESLRVILEQSLARAAAREGLADRQIKLVAPLFSLSFSLRLSLSLCVCVCARACVCVCQSHIHVLSGQVMDDNARDAVIRDSYDPS
eukprot:COSAG03_NODE_465_length_7686_cov_24.051008_8_plen_144_part_00